jgi:hypothetical protein
MLARTSHIWNMQETDQVELSSEYINWEYPSLHFAVCPILLEKINTYTIEEGYNLFVEYVEITASFWKNFLHIKGINLDMYSLHCLVVYLKCDLKWRNSQESVIKEI